MAQSTALDLCILLVEGISCAGSVGVLGWWLARPSKPNCLVKLRHFQGVEAWGILIRSDPMRPVLPILHREPSQ